MATATDDTDTRHLSAVGEEDGAAPAEASIEEQAEAEKEPETPPTQLAIPGTRERLTDKMGGGQPTESELRVYGARRPIQGQFEIGESVSLLIGAKITEAGIVTPTDEWGTVERTVRVHKARQLHVQHATPEALARELLRQLTMDEAVILVKEIADDG